MCAFIVYPLLISVVESLQRNDISLDRHVKLNHNIVVIAPQEEIKMKPEQSRMARAALQLGVRDIAEAAKVSTQTISRLEKGEELRERTVEDIKRAYEVAGARFVEDGDWVGAMVRATDSRAEV
ncbi:helix-turn-helix domain-containing protein [Rhizobium ruizarguesonis]